MIPHSQLPNPLGEFSRSTPNELPNPWDAEDPSSSKTKPPKYLIDEDLRAAAWVALYLRQPLLLTGDPGVGKTRFAEKLAYDLGLQVESIQIKSTTGGRDLLYSFDEIARFRSATMAGALAGFRGSGARVGPHRRLDSSSLIPQPPLLSYVRLEALGRAIVRAAGGKAELVLDRDIDPKLMFGSSLARLSTLSLADVFPAEFKETTDPRHSVVLIDELDKAPRDTPNDLLGEIEKMKFKFEELGFEIQAAPKFKPIVIITSNLERNLPDAFLRRCVFHRIETPNVDAMRKIAAARLLDGLVPECALLGRASKLFSAINERISNKKPGTAEFIAFVAYLRNAGLKPEETFSWSDPRAAAALRVVAKTNDDLRAATAALNSLVAIDEASRPRS